MSAPVMSYGFNGIDVGTLIDDGELYTTEGINKVPGVAIPKNAGVLNTNASGQLQVCPVGGLGPFYLPGEDALAGDLRGSVYGTKARGIKYVLKNSAALIANDPVKRSGTVPGQVEKFIIATDAHNLLVGYYRGLALQGPDLTSKAVLQANTTGNGQLCVIEKA
jgi:hypothetical protein